MKLDMSYTGWFPNQFEAGQGIGIIDNKIEYQGEWQPVEGFPNSGRDIYSPYHLLSYDVVTLEQP